MGPLRHHCLHGMLFANIFEKKNQETFHKHFSENGRFRPAFSLYCFLRALAVDSIVQLSIWCQLFRDFSCRHNTFCVDMKLNVYLRKVGEDSIQADPNEEGSLRPVRNNSITTAIKRNKPDFLKRIHRSW